MSTTTCFRFSSPLDIILEPQVRFYCIRRMSDGFNMVVKRKRYFVSAVRQKFCSMPDLSASRPLLVGSTIDLNRLAVYSRPVRVNYFTTEPSAATTISDLPPAREFRERSTRQLH